MEKIVKQTGNDFLLKVFLTMKLIVFIICFSSLSTLATGVYSQNARISLDIKNCSIKEVLKEIENSTEFYFLYNNELIDVERKVDIRVEEESIRNVIDVLFSGQHTDYSIAGRQIVIFPEDSPVVVTQQTTIRGKVTDVKGEPLPGVSVILKGTQQGTITDVDGAFFFPQMPANAVLQFSFVGMKMQEIVVGNQSVVDVVMAEETIGVDEVVVVGYGVQKKANLTGAVDQVTGEVFENRSMTNVTQGLQGVIPNLNISLSDGKPMRTASYNVRGTTSIGQGGSALVLIDGVEGDPALLNPNDIASVSVLKDASSAAIYGARGAFGVVLITTKMPSKEKTTISYNANFSVKSPTVVPDMVSDAYLFTTMFKEAFFAHYDYSRVPSTIHKAVAYTEAWHNELANRRPGSGKPEVETGSNGQYLYYANTDWYDLLYKDNLFAQDHNLTIQGGGKKADFIMSGHYLDQGGVFRYNSDNYEMFNIRAKGSAQLYDWLKVENNMEYSQTFYHNPLTVADGNVWYGLEGEAQPMSPMFNPDGTLTMAAAYSVGDLWYGKSGTDYKKRQLRNTTSFLASLLKDTWRINGNITFRNLDGDDATRRVQVPYSSQEGVTAYLGSSTNDYQKVGSSTKYLAANLYTEYEKLFSGIHYFKGMVGYNYEQSIYNYLLARRNGIIFEDAEDLNLTSGSGVTLSSNYSKWRIAGGFFRLNYAFKDRYLVEVNGRVDGSTKFPTKQQWGFFPSVSGGWRISEEPFWKVSDNLLGNVKMRLSFGSLGNGNINPYSYLELFSIKQMSRLIAGSLEQYTSFPTVIPNGLTWEKSTTTNAGLDFSSLAGKLSFSGDYYIRKTTDMFTVGTSLPGVFGAGSPKGNYADMTTRGWEISLSWRDKFTLANKPFHYNARFTLSDYVSKIDKYNNTEKNLGNYHDARTEYYEGMTIGEIWGYVTEGFFTSEEDVANHPSQSLYFASNTGIWLPGDIKFKNLNDDDVIDYGTNRVGDSGDRKVIGNSTPRYAFSFNLNTDWNGIFLSAFFQGIGKQDWFPGTDNALFWGQYNRPYNNIPKSMIGEIWSEDNPDTYFPRYRGYAALKNTSELAVVQSRYLQNVAYIRLKNLQIGYNLPSALTSRIKMQAARIYLSAENIWAWSPLYKHTKNFDVANIYGEDSEAKSAALNGGKNSIIANGGQPYNYPTLKSISLGLSVTF